MNEDSDPTSKQQNASPSEADNAAEKTDNDSNRSQDSDERNVSSGTPTDAEQNQASPSIDASDATVQQQLQQPATPKQIQQQQNQFQQQQQQFFAAPGFPKSPTVGDANDFFFSYLPDPRVFDEILDPNQNVREQWRQLAVELARMGDRGLEHRQKQIRRMLHQNGMAYSAFGDPSARDHHLELDVLPQLIPQAEWASIESALFQRAELLNMLLADLYGPRTLLSNRVLPTEVLLDHPHYCLPYHDLPVPGGKHIHTYAAELVRSPQGNWWIKSDRTDSPAGSGFALENRIAVSRAFPDSFRTLSVQRLAPYFIALRDNLIQSAKTNRDDPRIVILSTGTGSARYFEDSFLARYLGFTLVKTNDLVVRSNRVMLKTLAGLVPIDVIFRRHPTTSLDPLETGGNTRGIPGILQVIRDQQVVVVNAPGSGLVESPIFMAFMPRICQALTQRELKLPGIATWWAGEPESLELMLDRIDDIQLLPAFRVRGSFAPRPGAARNKLSPKHLRPENLTRNERIELLRANPTVWAGQEKLARSSSAVWRDGKLHPGYISIRSFLTASGSDWQSLPGGLVRISQTPHDRSRKPLQGGGTKDAWVLSDHPIEASSLLKKPGEPLQPVRDRDFLPSNIAENLCWLGRYLERADASARLLRAIAVRMTGENDPDEVVELPMLVRALAQSGQIDPSYDPISSTQYPKLAAALASNVLDRNDMDSLRYQVDRIVSLAGTVRDRLSRDAWRIVLELSSNFDSSHPEDCDLVDLLDLIDTLVVGLAAFSGFVSECMTRTHAYNFLNIGRRIEQALQSTALMKSLLVDSPNSPPELLESILEICESSLTYRSRYYANLHLSGVLDLLVSDEQNPRSLAYQLERLNSNLIRLPAKPGDLEAKDRQLADETFAAIKNVELNDLSQPREQGTRQALEDFLNRIEQALPEISTSISNRFFVHSGPVHQMVIQDDEVDFEDGEVDD